VESERHSGLDISAPSGTDVFAANSGRINLAMTLTVTGNTIIIDHGMKLFSSYCHMSKLMVKEGELVKKGQLIGKVGSTGFSTGPHLHWGISSYKTYINPWLLLKNDPFAWLNTDIGK
jgi:murein DD-endopeptidase MepM/ murein hydrolase activator NlpD